MSNKRKLTGYVHGKKGYDLLSLVQGMGLTKKEWEHIKTTPLIQCNFGLFDIAEVTVYLNKNK